MGALLGKKGEEEEKPENIEHEKAGLSKEFTPPTRKCTSSAITSTPADTYHTPLSTHTNTHEYENVNVCAAQVFCCASYHSRQQ